MHELIHVLLKMPLTAVDSICPSASSGNEQNPSAPEGLRTTAPSQQRAIETATYAGRCQPSLSRNAGELLRKTCGETTASKQASCHRDRIAARHENLLR
jgi:hypothetical protein